MTLSNKHLIYIEENVGILGPRRGKYVSQEFVIVVSWIFVVFFFFEGKMEKSNPSPTYVSTRKRTPTTRHSNTGFIGFQGHLLFPCDRRTGRPTGVHPRSTNYDFTGTLRVDSEHETVGV